MGIYIKGMEMPKSCDDCPHPTCTLWQSVNGGERNEKCPIVPVPPHCRLIDADALHYSRIRIAHNDGTIGGYNAVVMSAEIKDAPTIIEAEEE